MTIFVFISNSLNREEKGILNGAGYPVSYNDGGIEVESLNEFAR